MPRTARKAPGGMVYHVINRGVGRNKLFFNDDDYQAFEGVATCFEVLELIKRGAGGAQKHRVAFSGNHFGDGHRILE